MANGEIIAVVPKGLWWVELIKAIGPASSIALFLVYFTTAQLTPILLRMDMFMITNAEEMRVATEDRATLIRGQNETLRVIELARRADTERLFQFQEQVCINSAKSNSQTQKCLEIRTYNKE